MGEHLRVAVALLVLAATVRLFGIHAAAVVPDERLWLSRSSRILTRLHNDPDDATSHMVQPGLTPAAVMAAGEYAAHRFNSLLGVSFGEPYHVSDLDAARIANAAVSSLVAPALYLLAIDLFSPFAALLGGIFVALDSDLIGVARWAHLDSVMTVVVLISALLYLQAVRLGDWRFKLGSGIFWGLSILSKPTAGALVACFLLYRALRYFLVREYRPGAEKTLLSWSDVWAVLAGHLTFVALHTGVWHRNQEFLEKHPIWHPYIERTFLAARYLHNHVLIVAPLLLLCAWGVWYLLRRKAGPRTYHCAAALSVCGTLVLLMTTSPAVAENLVRYWVWAAGLSKMPDVVWATNAVREDHLAWGYLSLAWAQLPILFSAAFLFFVVSTLFTAARQRTEQAGYNLFVALTPLVWLALVGAASKQSWRYALPVLPFFYLGSAVALSRVLKSCLPSRRAYLTAACTGILLLCYTARSFPHYFLFKTGLSGGLAGAVSRAEPLPDFADEKLIAQIAAATYSGHAPIAIWVGGDGEILRMAAKRYNLDTARRLQFGVKSIQRADYALFFTNSLAQAHTPQNLRILFPAPVLTYTFNGVGLITLYKVRPKLAVSEEDQAATLQPTGFLAD